MRRLVAVLLAVLALSGCIRHPDGSNPTATDPVRIVVLGDSLTYQYGPAFRAVALPKGALVQVVGAPGTNPVDHPWVTWLGTSTGLDYVVLQDFAILGIDVHHTLPEYLAAWQTLVDAARSHLRPGGRIVVLAGVHPDLTTVHGIDVTYPMVPADAADGIHWTPDGANREAILLCQQLSFGDRCP